MTRKFGVQSYGVIAPMIRQGDNIAQIVSDTVLDAMDNIEDGDIIGITESVVARAQGNYVTINEVAADIKAHIKKYNRQHITLVNPIYSRNRFAMILKAFARAAGEKVWIVMPDVDEVGNVLRNHPFTGLDYDKYYRSIVLAEGKEVEVISDVNDAPNFEYNCFIDCSLHPSAICKPYVMSDREGVYINGSFREFDANLSYFCRDICDYGLLGSNKASEESLKLFPSIEFAGTVVKTIRDDVKAKTGKDVEVMVYGDGCFKDPVGGIWEFADPVVSPAYTGSLYGTPNEMKLKYLIDNDCSEILSQDELERAVRSKIKNKDNNLKGNMASQGTTPRKLTDLLGSLMDLTSGSGDRGTPIVVVKGYFKNLSSE